MLLKQGYEVIATNIIRSSSQSGWPLRNIHVSSDNGSFTFYVDAFFPLSLPDFYRTGLYIWITRRVSSKMLVLLTLRDHPSSPLFFGVGSVLLTFWVFCFYLLCVFTFWVPCCDVRYDFRIKRCSGRLYLMLFVVGLMSYLRYLYLFTYSGVQHILCCVFALFVFVLCTLCSQFLWIVHFDCPFSSLTFIWYMDNNCWHIC